MLSSTCEVLLQFPSCFYEVTLNSHSNKVQYPKRCSWASSPTALMFSKLSNYSLPIFSNAAALLATTVCFLEVLLSATYVNTLRCCIVCFNQAAGDWCQILLLLTVGIHQKHPSVLLLSALRYLLLENGHTKAGGERERKENREKGRSGVLMNVTWA